VFSTVEMSDPVELLIIWKSSKINCEITCGVAFKTRHYTENLMVIMKDILIVLSVDPIIFLFAGK